MPAHDAENPGGVSLAFGTVYVDCTPVIGAPGRATQPAQLRLCVAALVVERVGDPAPACAGTKCATLFGTAGAGTLVATSEAWALTTSAAGTASTARTRAIRRRTNPPAGTESDVQRGNGRKVPLPSYLGKDLA